MPRIIIPAENPVLGQNQRPEALQIQLSELTLTNTHIKESNSSLTNLKEDLKYFERTKDSQLDHTSVLFNRGHGFPCQSEDLLPINPVFSQHASGSLQSYADTHVAGILSGQRPSAIKSQLFSLKTDSLKCLQEYDLWCVAIKQFWIEFIQVPSSRNRPQSFIESFPLTLWITLPTPDTNINTNTHTKRNKHNTTQHKQQQHITKDKLIDYLCDTPLPVCDIELYHEPEQAQMYVLISLQTKIQLELNHYQYLFLMRLIETVTKKQEEMREDTLYILNETAPSSSSSISVAVNVQEVELCIVCPPIPEVHDTEVTPSSSESLNVLTELTQNNVAENSGGVDSALGK